MRLTSTLGGKIITSFLVVDLVLVGVGVSSLASQAASHSRLETMSQRDLIPLSHLRKAQVADHNAVLAGFAAGITHDPTQVKTLVARIDGQKRTATAAFAAMVEASPAELQGQATKLQTTYQQFIAADDAMKAGAAGPNGKALAEAAQGLFGAVDDQFNALADALLQDADAQRATANADYTRSMLITVALLALGLIVGLALGLTLARSVRRRTHLILDVLAGVARGDLTRQVTVSGDDELAQMGQALNAGLTAVRGAMTEVNGSANSLAASASGLTVSADRTAESVLGAAQAVDRLSTSAETVTRTVGSVATDTVELGASIRDISQNAQEAARVAGQAVGVVEETNAKISRLGNSSEEIGNVIQVIQTIAAQTSLLALNATIEAARAGEAGRGFAVVAGEVKELARETAEATDSVISRVQAIQADTQAAVRAIGEIGQIIEQINAFQGTIAAAVEEQSATTDSIGGSIAEALRVTQEIASTIQSVVGTTQGSTEAVASTRTLATDVAGMGTQLRTVVASFRV